MRSAFASLLSPDGTFGPLRHGIFRRIWFASLASNFGFLIQGVGASWAMTEMTGSPDMVALVTTAMMLPQMFVAIAAGAIADMYDRRIVGLVALMLSLAGTATLATLWALGFVTPWVLLGLCFFIGCSMSLFGPSWQASVSEQVPSEILPAAIALNGISFNIARSFGPAIGGLIVAAAGTIAAFVVNAFMYLPLLIVLFFWRREKVVSRLPPERLNRAIISGARYIMHSPPIRVVLIRTFVTGIVGGSLSALMPLVARDLLGAGAQIFGILLGAFGMGAVLGALNVSRVRRTFSVETSIRGCVVIAGTGTALVGLSTIPALTCAILLVAGAGWTLVITLFNIGIQMGAPRWVAGRTLAAFQASIAGGIAIGSWIWGHVAEVVGVDGALMISGCGMASTMILGLLMPVPPTTENADPAADPLADPEVQLAITPRSGPIVIELEYRVNPADAREFYRAIQHVQLVRSRNGGYDWSISRDVADPELWIERFHCPTWLDYLRQRTRLTQVESEVQAAARKYHMGPEPVRIRRMLERPFGSVRWKDEAPDPAVQGVLPIPVASTTGT
ncbi:MAG: MFS transporter [Alphaproteobacteria bacterium]|nr:MFS transporter [Alphaproteobacteria bacterium]